MHNWVLIAGYIISFAAAALLVPLIRRVAARYGWVDRPDGDRKVHGTPVPTVGGLGIAGGFAAGLLFLLAMEQIVSLSLYMPPTGLWIGAGLILLTGVYDDVYGLGFKNKFIVQFVVAYILLYSGYRVDVGDLLFLDLTPYEQALYSVPLTLIWVVGVMNAVNLIDGLDGLAAGVVMIAFAGLALMFDWWGDTGVAVLACLMIPALAGFLIHNFNPASIFMGDSGSLFLGYMLASFTLAGDVHSNPWMAQLILVVVLGLPLLDTALSFIRRWVGGHGIFAADHDHIHHRLARVWSQQKTVFVLYGVELGFAAAAVTMSIMTPAVGLVIFAAVLIATFVGLASLGYVSSMTLDWYRRARQAHPSYEQSSEAREDREGMRSRETAADSPVWWSSSPNHITIDHVPHQERTEPSEAEQSVN